MPGAMLTRSAPAPASAPADPKAAAPVLKNPFTRAALEHTEQFLDSSEGLLTAASHQSGPHDVAPFGFCRSLVIKVTASGGTVGVQAPVLADDGPWNILENVTLMDVNGRPIFGPVDGFDLYLANLLGGYRYITDPTALPGYAAFDNLGNFTFYLRVPVEITAYNALGSLPNLTSSATYKLSYSIAANSTLYSTVTDGIEAAIQVEAWLEAWTQPLPTDSFGVPNQQLPPAVGTTQYWSKSPVVVNAGEQRLTLQRRGNLLRKVLFIFRDAAQLRSTADWPTDFRIEFEQVILHGVERQKWIDDYVEYSGITVPTGVIPWDFTHEGGRAGSENRELYLATTQSSRIDIVGTFAAAGTVTMLTNDVAPAPKVG